MSLSIPPAGPQVLESEVQVDARLVAAADIVLLLHAGQGDDASRLRPGQFAEAAGDLAPVHPRHGDVQQHGGGRLGGRQRQRRGAVVGHGRLVAPEFHEPAERVGGVAAIVNDEDAQAGRTGGDHFSGTVGGGVRKGDSRSIPARAGGRQQIGIYC
jgi:hypothetical protein